jgi:hypothetical protein
MREGTLLCMNSCIFHCVGMEGGEWGGEYLRKKSGMLHAQFLDKGSDGEVKIK